MRLEALVTREGPKANLPSTSAIHSLVPCLSPLQDMLAEFDAVSIAMAAPDADLTRLAAKMDR